MMPYRTYVMATILALGLLSRMAWGQQQNLPTCEEQLAEVRATLLYIRVSRQYIEEHAGRVTATLQHKLEEAITNVERAKTRTPSPPEPHVDDPSSKGSPP